MANFDLLIRDGTVVTPNGTEQTDVAVLGGRIAAIGNLSQGDAETTIEAKGLYVLPGIIDSQVHFREPGLEHKEDFESGTKAAIAGGVTGVFDMPNNKPVITDVETYTEKFRGIRGRTWCDYGLYVGATAENAETLADLELMPACCGVKVFMGSSTGDLLVSDEEALKRILISGRRRVAVHCEDEARLQDRRLIAESSEGDVAQHPVWRDEQTAFRATSTVISLARLASRRLLD